MRLIQAGDEQEKKNPFRPEPPLYFKSPNSRHNRRNEHGFTG